MGFPRSHLIMLSALASRTACIMYMRPGQAVTFHEDDLDPQQKSSTSMVFILITAVSGIRLITSLLVSYCVRWPTGCYTLPLATLHRLLELAVAIRLKKEPRSCPRTLLIALRRFQNFWYHRWETRQPCRTAQLLLMPLRCLKTGHLKTSEISSFTEA
jgi:hypothetical protein